MDKEKFLDSFLGDTSNLSYIKKERNNYLTQYLYIGLFANIFAIIRSVKFIIIDFESGLYMDYLALSLTGFICRILLLNWQISGFYIHCIVIIFGIFQQNVFAICWGIIWALLDFAFFQLKKDNISAWTHLTGNYSNVSTMDFNEVMGFNENQDEYKKCPFCAEKIKKDAIVCRYCQRSLNDNPTQP